MPLTTGLASWWPLSETSGTRVDVVGGKNLTDSGATAGGNFNPDFNAGSFGGPCAVFDGTTFLSRPNDTDFHFGASDYSVSAWFNITAPNGDTQVLGKYGASGTLLNWTYRVTITSPPATTNVVEFIVGSTDSGTPLHSASFRNVALARSAQNNVDRNVQLDTQLTVGKWYHMVALRTASGITMACLNNGGVSNGAKLVTDPRLGTMTASTSRFGIGARVDGAGTGSNFFIGRVCNVGIWDRLLTEAEIGQLWNGGYGLDYPFTGII